MFHYTQNHVKKLFGESNDKIDSKVLLSEGCVRQVDFITPSN